MGPDQAILLADAASIEAALRLANAEARWFVMDDAVRVLPLLRPAIDDGADVTVCATDAAAMAVEVIPGVRFGSQYDHAAMFRTAARTLAFTGAGVDDCSPRRADRTVLVRVSRTAKVTQALRSAVGYAAGDLRVAVLFEPPAWKLIEEPTANIDRALATLRGLDHPIVAVAPGEVPARLRWDLEVTW